MIRYECMNCGIKLDTEDSLGGKTEACPGCGHHNAVPRSKAQLALDQSEAKRLQQQQEARRRQEAAEALSQQRQHVQQQRQTQIEAASQMAQQAETSSRRQVPTSTLRFRVLETLSLVFFIIGMLTLAGGVLGFLIFAIIGLAGKSGESFAAGFFMGLVVSIAAILYSLPAFAASEFIKLMIGMARDTRRTADVTTWMAQNQLQTQSEDAFQPQRL